MCETRIRMDVRPGEVVSHIGNSKVGLLFHLARNALRSCFVHVTEASGEVICASGRFLFAYNNEQFVIFVQNKGCRGRTRVKVINEAASVTALAFGIVDIEIIATAHGTMGKIV